MLYFEKIYSENKFNVSDNKAVLSHWQNNIELIYITEGSMKCMVQGKEFDLEKGSICIINANSIHSIYCGKEDCGFKVLYIEPELLTSSKYIYDNYILPILSDDKFTHLISNSTNDVVISEILSLMDEIGDLEKRQIEAYELSVIGILHMIIQRLYLLYKNHHIKESVDLDILIYRKMAEYIYKNYNEHILLADIAESANISKNKCCSLFKKYSKNSPINFLNLYRLEKGAYLLENTNENIVSIALSCGFDQASYFNKLFLKEYKMTPSKYRKFKRVA